MAILESAISSDGYFLSSNTIKKYMYIVDTLEEFFKCRGNKFWKYNSK